MITIGQIVKPQGVRGEVKVRPLTDDPSRFCVLKSVTVGNAVYRILSVRVSGGDVYLLLDGVSDRNAAEGLRGKYIAIEREIAKPLEDGEFFIADLIGSDVVIRGEKKSVGKITAVRSFGAADVIEVERTERGSMSFAFVKALNAEYNVKERTLSVDGDAFMSVAVYDDEN